MNTVRDDAQPIFNRSFWWFGAGLFLLMLALLVGPPVPNNQQEHYCVVNAKLPGPFGVSMNCDSPEFMRLAREPSGLLEPLNTRQSRPGMVAAAAALAWTLSPLSGLANKLGIQAGRSDIDPKRIATSLAKDIPGYLAYIILNVVILLATFYFFRRICEPWADNSTSGIIILAALGLMLVANDVVKAFVWSPHTQMFNILVPVFALYASMRAGAGALVERRFALWVGLAAGIGGTAYPLFVIVLPSVAVCAFVFAFRDGARTTWTQSGINLVLLAVLVFLPEALWYAFVRFKTGGFYQHEMVRYNEVVWMLDAWHEGVTTLAALWLSKLARLLWFAGLQAGPLAAVMIAVAALGLTNRSEAATRPPFWRLVATAILVSALTAAFYASVGLIKARIAYSVIPALIVVAAAGALALTAQNITRRRTMACWCVAVAVIAAIYTVVKNGPYS